MPEGMLLPKFLTPEIAKIAIAEVLNLLFNRYLNLAKRNACHVGVIVPSMKDERAADYPDYPNYNIVPALLYEESFGKELWPEGVKFDDIARCKGLQLWHNRNDGRTDIMPHLLFPGDARWWGGVKRQGIVVFCSGIQPWFDMMVSGMVADMMIAMAYNAWMKSEEHEKKIDFLT